MSNISISITNSTTLLSDLQVQQAIRAFQKQVHEHFFPVWRIDASVQFLPKGSVPDAGSWRLTIVDKLDGTDAGDHGVSSTGIPSATSEVGDKKNGQWTITVSHELRFDMLPV